MSEPTCDWNRDGEVCGKTATSVSIGIRDRVPHTYLCQKHGKEMAMAQGRKGMPLRVVPCDPFVIFDVLHEAGVV